MCLIDQLLQKTSRTFAISIPCLDDRLRRSVSVAYLLFRIADTVEDELEGTPSDRVDALRSIASGFGNDPSVLADALAGIQSEAAIPSHEGYAELLGCTPLVVGEFRALPRSTQRIIAAHLARTASGMADFLSRDLSGGSFDDLRAYCYAVAGIVGEMLSALFVEACPALASAESRLIEQSAAFGEGLQLVNIVRDSAVDIRAGRHYVPSSMSRESLIGIARADLAVAVRYIETLATNGADIGVVRFNAINTELALRTLTLVEDQGPGAKLSRERVADVIEQINGSGSSSALVGRLGLLVEGVADQDLAGANRI